VRASEKTILAAALPEPFLEENFLIAKLLGIFAGLG